MISKGGTILMDKCPYCGAETRPGDNFCLNCGNRLLPTTPSSQQAQPVMGDATLPASDDWALSSQGVGASAPQAGFSAPTAPGTWAADTNAATIAASDGPTVRGDVSASVIDRIEYPAHLVLRADNGEVLQDYTLEKLETSIGRAPNSDILLSKDKLTSRRHATIRYENGNYVLYDERSANGTFVNGQQLEDKTPRVLQDNDHIGIGEHEMTFHAYKSPSSGVDIESMPTISVSAPPGEVTYRTREDELLTATPGDEFSTRTMNGDIDLPGAVPFQQASSAAIPEQSAASIPNTPVPPPSPVLVPAPTAEAANELKGYSQGAPLQQAPLSGPTADVSMVSTSSAPASEKGVTFSRLTGLPQPTIPDVSALTAALATLDGQVTSLQEQLNASQEAIRNHDADITQTANQLRSGVRRVSDRMNNAIADVARSREQLAWADLLQLMEDVMNNPRDIEYVTKLARKARELNKVFQIHQNVLNTMAECNSLLRNMLGEDKE
jgi:predicted component of type VI protein secretion system